MDIGGCLRGLGLEQYEVAFRNNEIGGEVLPELAEADLETLGMPLGHRKRLLKAIRALGAASRAARRQGLCIAIGGLGRRGRISIAGTARRAAGDALDRLRRPPKGGIAPARGQRLAWFSVYSGLWVGSYVRAELAVAVRLLELPARPGLPHDPGASDPTEWG